MMTITNKKIITVYFREFNLAVWKSFKVLNSLFFFLKKKHANKLFVHIHQQTQILKIIYAFGEGLFFHANNKNLIVLCLRYSNILPNYFIMETLVNIINNTQKEQI